MTELHIWPGDNIFLLLHSSKPGSQGRRVSLLTYEDEVRFVDDAANDGWGHELGSIVTE